MQLIKDIYNKSLSLILSVVFPNTCLGCGEVIPEGEFFCYYCTEHMPIIETDKHCKRCGLSKKKCECNKKIFCFDCIAAPFYNIGAAKNAMYIFKFRKRPYISAYFANRMAITVKYAFYGIRFDGICYVPLSSKSLRKRGFNQSREIAVHMSRLLKIPLIENALGCKNKKKSQHTVSRDKREENVKGVYYPKGKIKGRILLVDDIKTTGATLNECSKQLLIAGADSVYCITGIITGNKKG